MVRTNRRDAERRREDFIGKLLLLAAALIALAGIAAYQWIASPEHRIAKDSLCPERGPLGREVILVDGTDKLSTPQREDLRNKLREVRDTLRKGHEISFYTVAEIGPQLLAPIVVRCSPGNPKDANLLYENPEMIKKAWHGDFADPVDHVIEQLTSEDATRPHSPIMESIQSVAISAFGKGFQPTERRLVVVSDLLQNTTEFSHYRGFEDFESFRRTPYYQRVKPDLQGVSVTVIFLRRDRAVPAEKLMEFWESYFEDAGAKIDLVKRVRG